MDTFATTITLLLSAADILFNVWWLVVFGPILPAKTRKWRKRNILLEILVLWVVMAVVRGILVFNPKPFRPFAIPEPINTIVFAATGVGLFALYFLRRQRQRRQFMHKTGEVNTVEDLLNLTPTEFEDMVVELYRMAGHEAKRTGAVGDNGVDVEVQAKNGEKWIVQCKRWKGSVGEPIVRDFYGAMHHEKADKGTIITAGRFTRQATDWSAGKAITLYDGEKFLKSWRQARQQQEKVQSSVPVSSSAL
jgi:HJR/Mrr/RecB family endonuclease